MSHRGETFTLEQSRPSERLDVFLRARFPAVSRGTIQRLIEQGHIRVNDQVVKPTHVPRAGEKVSIFWPEAKPAEAKPQFMALDILFEDADLLVLNKPPGIVVHPAAGHDEGTLVNALLHHCGAELSGIGGVARPGIVHRLDKDTSGLLVVAKTEPAQLALVRQLQARTVKRTYLALVRGRVERDGTVEAPIGRHPVQRTRMAVVASGKPAVTHYRVRERFAAHTLLECGLETGRTHQIRVHLASIGHPLEGDPVYAGRGPAIFPRQALHAWKLAFDHPASGAPMAFESPLPADMSALLASLRP